VRQSPCLRLFAIFVSAHRKPIYHDPAVRAYGSVVGFKARKEMLDLAANAYFDERKKNEAP